MKDMMQQTLRRIVGNKKSMLVAAGLLAITFLALTLPAWETQAEERRHGNPFTLAGTWKEEIPVPFPFVAHETFTEAGGSVETDHGPGGHAVGIGTWTRIGPRKFLATFHKQVFKPASGGSFPFESDGTVKVRRLITLSPDGQAFTGVATVEVYDQAGNLTLNFNHPFDGTRVVPEPPTF